MTLSNPFRPDPRVVKEASSLAEAGYKISIICWDRTAELTQHEWLENGIEIIRVQNVPSNYGIGMKQLTRLPRFLNESIQFALNLNPDIVHCHDLDTLYAGWRLKKITHCKLIYDTHEDYPLLMSLYLPMLMIKSLSIFERLLINQVDHIITVSPLISNKYQGWGKKNVTDIGNFQSLKSFDQVSPEKIEELRHQIGLSSKDLVVVYIGGFSPNRLLLPLIESVKGIPEIQLLMWGDGRQREAVEREIKLVSNARYLGWAPNDQVPILTALADVVYYCLVPDYPYSTPNTLSNAMIAGRPIIASRVGDLGRIVEETGCGILLNEINPQTIRVAVEKLRDPELRRQLGQAGRKAAMGKYNWDHESEKLIQIYRGLT